MTEQNKVAPNLTGGVSQQPMGVRSPTQVTECLNSHLSLVDGCAKRPPTIQVARIIESLPANNAYHLVERDGEDYLIVVTDTDPEMDANHLRVFNMAGEEVYVKPADMDTGLDMGYTGNAPGNHIPAWEHPGLTSRWLPDGVDQTSVVTSGPTLTNWDPTASVQAFSPALGSYELGTITHNVKTRFGDGSTFLSVYVKKNAGLDHIAMSLYNETLGVWYSCNLGWSGTDLIQKNGPGSHQAYALQVGETTIEDASDGWWRVTLSFDMTTTVVDSAVWPRSGDLISSVQLSAQHSLGGTTGDMWSSITLEHLASEMPDSPPPIQNGFGPFRFLSVADATFICNTDWKTRAVRDGADTKEAWLGGLGVVASSKVVIDVASWAPRQEYEWSIDVTAGGGTTHTAKVLAGYEDLVEIDGQIHAVGVHSPFGRVEMAEAIKNSINTVGAADLIAVWDGATRVTVTAPSTEVTSVTVTDLLMVASNSVTEDTITMTAVEQLAVNDTFFVSITNDAGTFSTTGVAVLAADTLAQMAAKLRTAVSGLDASITVGVVVGNGFAINSDSPISAKLHYAEAEEAASNPSAYSHFHMAGEEVNDVAYISILQGIADSTYTYEITNTAGTFTGSDVITTLGSTGTAGIATRLASAISNEDPSLEGTVAFGSVVEVRSSVPISSIKTSDAQAENLMSVWHQEVESISDLPLTFRNGFVAKISTDPTTASEDQYVKFLTETGEEGFGVGQWVEATDWGAARYMDGSCMPHKLSLLYDDAVGTNSGSPYAPYFVFGQQDWTQRTAGADPTNPAPSFAGKALSDVLFHANRLGFLSDQNVILSEAGVYFNFWRTTVAALPDSDPIDISVNEPNIAVLDTAASMGEQLVVTSSGGQFVLDGTPPTPATAYLRKVTAYRFQNLRPAASGRSLYYSVPGPSNSTIVEFSRVQDGFTTDEVTRAAPAYITGTVEWMTAQPSANFLAVKAAAANKLYVYKYDWRGDQKSQSAFSTWTWPSTSDLVFMEFLENRAIMLFKHGSDLYLETLTLADALQDGSLGYQVHLDRRLDQDSVASAVYSAPNTTITFGSGKEFEVGDVPTLTDSSGVGIAVVSSDESSIVVAGDYSAADFYVGLTYSQVVTLSSPLPQTQDRLTGDYYPKEGRFSVVTLHVQVANTATFNAAVSPGCGITPFSQDYSYLNGCDPSQMMSGYQQVSVMSGADELEVTLTSSDALPCRFTSLIWKGDLSPRGIL